MTRPSPFFFSVRIASAAVVQAEHHALEVEQDVDHVLAHAVERGVLVHHARDLHLGRRHSRASRRAARGAARCRACGRSRARTAPWSRERDSAKRSGRRRYAASKIPIAPLLVLLLSADFDLLRIQLDDEALVDRLTAARLRCGSALNVPFSALASTSIHSGTSRDRCRFGSRLDAQLLFLPSARPRPRRPGAPGTTGC